MDIKHQTNKVGVIPYRFARTRSGEDEIQFLVHLPKPKKAGEEGQMSWGMARGTVKAQDAQGQWHDIRDAQTLRDMPAKRIEDHWHTAQCEMTEELGIDPSDVLSGGLRDHGLLLYDSPSKGRYPLHCYSFQIASDVSVQDLNFKAVDSQKVAWKSLDELTEMAHSHQSAPLNERFKAGYLELLEQVAQQIGLPPRMARTR
jgi:hypothetical protein